MKTQTLVQSPSGRPISSLGFILEISITLPSAGDVIRLFLLAPDKTGVIREGFLKKYIHQTVKIVPMKYNGLQNQPIITDNMKKMAMNGMPAGCIGVKIEALIESIIFISFPIKILVNNYLSYI